jgi:hypothetical protein
MSFLLHVAIIHELAHVVMHTFASQPTPVKFSGNRGIEGNVSGIERNGAEVAQGELGGSMEDVMVGGYVSMALPFVEILSLDGVGIRHYDSVMEARYESERVCLLFVGLCRASLSTT